MLTEKSGTVYTLTMTKQKVSTVFHSGVNQYNIVNFLKGQSNIQVHNNTVMYYALYMYISLVSFQ